MITQLVLDEPTSKLCATIASGGLAPVRLAMLAPGGHGKTALLAHLAGAARDGGLAVSRYPGDVPTPGLLLVDDAHTLDDTALAVLRGLAEDDRFGLVVAARPHPRPAGLAELLAGLRGQIVLRPFDAAHVRDFLVVTTGSSVPSGFAEFVREQTGGVPGLVRRVADAGEVGAEPFALPAAALAGLGHQLESLPPSTFRLLLALHAGAEPDLDVLAGVLDTDDAAAALAAARATGLVGADGALLPIAAAAVASSVPIEHRAAVRQRLADQRLAGGGPVLPLVRPWLDDDLGLTGLMGHGAAFEIAGREALPDDPELAARLFAAAVDAGRPSTEVGAGWAEALARCGELDDALRLADSVISTGNVAGREDAALVAATALAHRGQLARSAELLKWSGSARCRPFAAVALIGTGARAAAVSALDESTKDEMPTLVSGALSAMAKGIEQSVSGSSALALSTVVSAAEMLEPVGSTVLLPDSPAALGALVALHGGESATAERLLERALAGGVGAPALTTRHRLLLGWAALLRGDSALAADRLAAVGMVGAQPRDRLFAVALEVGLARRASDLGALRQAWARARDAVIRYPIDLFTLLPFGEFAVAAARLGDHDRLAPHLARARDLLAELGDPPLWAVPLHWSALHAAIVAERPDEAEQQTKALSANASDGPYCAALAAAAESWLKILTGEVDPDEVESAAHGLRAAGLPWDGARLAGQAAIRTADRKAMLNLLDCARSLLGASAATPETPETTTKLSERELQVARLVLAGNTYKQVGAQLFISAKTVEHHMARMRQRLGATSRKDLLTQLKTLVTHPH